LTLSKNLVISGATISRALIPLPDTGINAQSLALQQKPNSQLSVQPFRRPAMQGLNSNVRRVYPTNERNDAPDASFFLI